MKSWDPFRDLLTIQDRMNKLFETVLTGPATDDAEGINYWRPVSEVVETAQALEIECELAGLDRSAIELRVDENVLVVQGERSRPEAGGDWTFHRLERPHGKFLRKFELIPGLDLDQVRASLEGGLLRVTLPKRPESRARTIPLDRNH
ncbi:MAG: Hsp20/alpha crystallin family protein [Acidobacteria bacterium]|nr:Hsp20/alpha crystallin family protein [Acidobacteriota bacterium]